MTGQLHRETADALEQQLAQLREQAQARDAQVRQRDLSTRRTVGKVAHNP